MTVPVLVLEAVLVGFALAWLAAETFRDEHLLVLRWKNRGWWVLEHRGGGRYESIRVRQLPAAVARYAHTRAATEREALGARMREWRVRPFGTRA